MTCKNCNAPLEEQARFCVKCGTPVAETQEGQSSQAASQDATRIVLKPRKTDNPVQPPRRPTPAQTANHEQESASSTRETGNAQHATDIDEPASIPSDIVHEQPTHTLPPDANETVTHTPEQDQDQDQSDAHYKQKLMASHDSIQNREATPVTPYDVPTLPFEMQSRPQEATPVTPYDIPTLPFEIHSVPHPELIEIDTPEVDSVKRDAPLSSSGPPQPLLYYRLNTTTKGSQKLPAVVNRTAYNRGRRRGCIGCILSGLSTVIVLLLIVGAVWVFALRPYTHNVAQQELDSALTSAVNQLPTQAKLLPSGSTVPLNENTINNLIVLNLAPSNPVQHPKTSINGQNIRLDFQLYGFPCVVTMVPTLDNGRLVVNKVETEGIFSAIMSPEEMASLLNKHLNDAQSRLQRSVNNVKLKDHEVDLTLG